MLKFPKIAQFRQVISEVKYRSDFKGADEHGNPIYQHTEDYPTLTFRGTVKLHGTNASVVLLPDGTITAQSRNRELTLDRDNAGFAKFVFEEQGEEYWRTLLNYVKLLYSADDKETVAIYGEWCGQGIQSGVAISKLEKMFVIFAVRIGTEEDTKWFSPAMAGVDGDRVFQITQFPYYEITVDFNKPRLIQNTLIEKTLEVEGECPVGAFFGHKGVGEGIVWNCVTEGFDESRFWFKTKGKKHSVSKVKTLAPVDVEKMNSIDEFASYVVTEARLLQGVDHLKEMGKDLSQKSTGDYLRWLVNDVMSEEADTLEASGLTSKEVNKHISGKARKWFFSWLDSNAGL